MCCKRLSKLIKGLLKVDQKDFIFNSDYPVDKIVWLEKGEFDTDNYGNFEKTIAHKLLATPFVKGVWTYDDWATTWMFGSVKISDGAYQVYSEVGSDSTNVYLSGFVDLNAKKTIKYKIWGVWNESDTYSTEAQATAGQGSTKFLFNTDYNYPRLVIEGYLDKGKTAGFNLDEIPYCDVWGYMDMYIGGQNKKVWMNWHRDGFGIVYDDLEYVKITTTGITLRSAANSPDKIYYRVYL